MEKKFFYILFLLVLVTQGCCFGSEESVIDMKPRVSHESAIKMQSNTDTIYEITYPNSFVKFSPNNNRSAIHLSFANEFTTMFIFSTKGFDTITIQVVRTLSYESNKCDPDYVAITNYSPKLISFTTDTCFFKRYERASNYKEIYDTLIVN